MTAGTSVGPRRTPTTPTALSRGPQKPRGLAGPPSLPLLAATLIALFRRQTFGPSLPVIAPIQGTPAIAIPLRHASAALEANTVGPPPIRPEIALLFPEAVERPLKAAMGTRRYGAG